jgi:hypothetical protein
MKDDKKQTVKGLKSMRGRGELQHCENCDCKRYGPCGCTKKETK